MERGRLGQGCKARRWQALSTETSCLHSSCTVDVLGGIAPLGTWHRKQVADIVESQVAPRH